MKKFFLIGLILLAGCSNAPDPQEPVNPSTMTESEKTEEIQRTLDRVGVKLPENWEDMTKQERGAFLLPILLQADMSE